MKSLTEIFPKEATLENANTYTWPSVLTSFENLPRLSRQETSKWHPSYMFVRHLTLLGRSKNSETWNWIQNQWNYNFVRLLYVINRRSPKDVNMLFNNYQRLCSEEKIHYPSPVSTRVVHCTSHSDVPYFGLFYVRDEKGVRKTFIWVKVGRPLNVCRRHAEWDTLSWQKRKYNPHICCLFII